MPQESKENSNTTAVEAVRELIAASIDRLTPEIQPAFKYDLAPHAATPAMSGEEQE